MVQNNKILTVSYGTFSCTLEGFDDSFSTMKAIAEYFRDLASDDRYFGAEPPQPDAEMLARIAGREIERRVEAHQSENGIVLRAGGPPAALTEAPKAAEPAPKVAAPAVAPVAQPDQSAEGAAPRPDAARTEMPEVAIAAPDVVADDVADVAKPEVAEIHQPEPVIKAQAGSADIGAVDAAEVEPVADSVVPEADSIASKLQRIRAVVSRNEAKEAVVEYSEDEDADVYGSDAQANAETSLDAAMASAGLEQDDADETIQQDIDADLEEDAAELVEEEVETSLAAVMTAAALELDEADEAVEDDIDADLDQDAAGLDEEEDETSLDAVMTAAAMELDEAVEEDADLDQDAAELDEEEVVAQEADEAFELDEDVDEALDLVAADLDENADDSDMIEDQEDPFAAPLDTAADDTLIDENDDEDLFGDLDEEYDDQARFGADVDEMDQDDEDELDNILAGLNSDDETDDDIDQAPAAQKARVLKVKRTQLEAAIASGTLEEVTDEDTDEIKATDGDDDASLSAEDEAELMRELAEVEAEFGVPADAGTSMFDDVYDDAEEDSAEDEDEDDEDEPVAGRAALPPAADADEADLSRLMDAADRKMGDPESSSQREAYSHLRAAVAATKAEKSAGGDMDTVQGDGAYREDLATVVRPRRPEATGNRPRSPVVARPAPLKLVAEQRVDAENAVRRGPVRPRRVAAPADGAAEDMQDGAFAQFALEMGAHDLHQVLEAAAAYMSFVEGRAQFSRPQLMTKVRQVDTVEFNREDGLRSFGQLLREGKIEKTGGGRFTASEEIGFRPDERAAG